MNRKIFFILFFSAAAMISSGQKLQITESEDGKYIGPDNKPYTGIYKEYFDDGSLKLEMPILKGLPNGNVVINFRNHQKNEIRAYRKGKMHGTWITWNESGVKVAEANYLNGKKDGKWYVWDDHGTMRYDMTYKKGEKSGTWLMWDENGNLSMEKKYK